MRGPLNQRPHFTIVPNPAVPGWPGICCSVRGDLGCLFKHAKTVGYRADSLAGSLDLCPSVLRREFQKAFGMSLKNWLVAARSVEVRRRLRGSESIEDIAISVGFSHSKELSREFKKVYQVKPSVFRIRERQRAESGERRAESGERRAESGERLIVRFGILCCRLVPKRKSQWK